jgi:hypothetical protein
VSWDLFISIVSSNRELYKTVLPGLLSICTCVTSPKKELIILKLDFENAFDRIDHQTMLQIMEHKGFNQKWIQWMDLIFKYEKSVVLLNGVSDKVFHCRRGV